MSVLEHEMQRPHANRAKELSAVLAPTAPAFDTATRLQQRTIIRMRMVRGRLVLGPVCAIRMRIRGYPPRRVDGQEAVGTLRPPGRGWRKGLVSAFRIPRFDRLSHAQGGSPMRWTPGRMSGNIEDRRGRGGGIGMMGPGMGLGGVVLLVLSLLFGQNLFEERGARRCADQETSTEW